LRPMGVGVESNMPYQACDFALRFFADYWPWRSRGWPFESREPASRRISVRSVVDGVPCVFVTFFLAMTPAAAADNQASCNQRLTFRWTSGDPIKGGVSHPGAASLENQPFLRDPEILSVTPGHDWLGSNATIKVGAPAAEVLRVQSSSHLRQQMLIMLGDTVVVSAMVPAPISDVLVLHMPDTDQLGRVVTTLRKQQRCLGVEPSLSGGPPHDTGRGSP